MRRHNLVSSSLRGRLLPILALAAGMGFVIPGGAVPAAGPVVPSIAPSESRGELATVRAAGERLFDMRGPRGRLTGGSGADAGPSGLPCRGHPAELSALRWTPASASPAGAVTAVAARDAIARAGRLSAPTTAPPASPF